MDPTKKISFSFSKSAKLTNIFTPKPKENNELELIDCLEGHSIKIKNAVEEIKTPLIIPLRDDAKDLLDRVRQSRQIKANKEEIEPRPDSELTLDELAAKELIEETKQQSENAPETKVHSLPVTADKSLPENHKEPTIDDYENVPISDYGLAMLRGMGWTETTGIGKQNKQVTKSVDPELRPKGMGLGADKVVNAKKAKPAVDERGKELNLIKGAYAKIIAGKHKGSYCEVVGFDDEAGRIIVKTTIKRDMLTLNEFLVVPVTKQEYIKTSKIINNATYEENKNKIGSSNIEKIKLSDPASSRSNDKPSNSKHKSSSSDVSHTSRDKHKETSSAEDRHGRKRRDRSESPYPATESTAHRSRHRSRSPSRKHSKKSKHHRTSKSPSYTPSKKHRSATKNSESSDADEYGDKKFNGSKSREESKRPKKKKKKSKKHRKHRDGSYSSDEEYRKKKKKKSKKYSSDDDSDGSSSTSEVDKFGRSRKKYRLSKNDR